MAIGEPVWIFVKHVLKTDLWATYSLRETRNIFVEIQDAKSYLNYSSYSATLVYAVISSCDRITAIVILSWNMMIE